MKMTFAMFCNTATFKPISCQYSHSTYRYIMFISNLEPQTEKHNIRIILVFDRKRKDTILKKGLVQKGIFNVEYYTYLTANVITIPLIWGQNKQSFCHILNVKQHNDSTDVIVHLWCQWKVPILENGLV